MLVKKSLRNTSDVTLDDLFKVFDAQIQSVLLSGREVWGTDTCHRTENA